MLRTLFHRIRSLAADENGVAAVEAAFVAPAALILMSVGVAAGQTLELYHKTVVTAHDVTDLVSRTPLNPDPNVSLAEQVSQSQLCADLSLSQMTMYPENTTSLQIVMTELSVNSSGNTGTVVWSKAYNGAVAMVAGTTIALDPAYVASGASYLLYGQVSYSFQPLGGILKLPQITLTSSDMLTIRNAQQITIPDLTTAQCS
jgi:Flp pilus assembly protein TadG